MKVRFFDPGLAYRNIRPEIDLEIQRVLSAGDLILRKDGEIFEQNLADFVGTKYAVAVNSGTDALYLSLWALGIGPGDEVITSSHTFVASVQVIHQLGATPVLADCNYDLQVDMQQVAALITPNTRAIIPVHLTGDMADLDTLRDIVEAAEQVHGTKIHIIEDAAQALGASKDGIKAGSFGTTGCFSFYPAKILGAYGDAGGITTNDENLANELRELRNHYKKDYSKWGINSRLDNIHAAVLNVKMKYLPKALERREEVANMYAIGLRELPIKLPEYRKGRVWQDYVIRTSLGYVDEITGVFSPRDVLYEFLKDNGIDTMKNEYPFPVRKRPRSLQIEASTLRIPCNENLTDNEVKYVIEKIKEHHAK